MNKETTKSKGFDSPCTEADEENPDLKIPSVSSPTGVAHVDISSLITPPAPSPKPLPATKKFFQKSFRFFASLRQREQRVEQLPFWFLGAERLATQS